MQDDGKLGSKRQTLNSNGALDINDTVQEAHPVPKQFESDLEQNQPFSQRTTPMPMGTEKRRPAPPSTFPSSSFPSEKEEAGTDSSGRVAETVSIEDTDQIAAGDKEYSAGRSPAERTRVSTRGDETDRTLGSLSDWSEEPENVMARPAIHTPPPGSGAPKSKEVFQRVVSPPEGTPLRRRSNILEAQIPSIMGSTTFRLLIAAILMLVLLTGLLIYLSMEKGRTVESAGIDEKEVVMVERSFEAQKVEISEPL